ARFKEHKGPNNATVAAAAETPPVWNVIRTQRVPVKPMSVDEAVMQLQLLNNDFLLFRNAATETLSVVYRRKDGGFGLVEPEPAWRHGPTAARFFPPGDVAGPMEIIGNLPEALVPPHLKGRHKEEVLRELAAAMGAQHPDIDAGRLVDVLWERERLG